MSAPESLRDEVAAVLAEHARSDWSDSTFACTGCRQRFERETQAEWESLTTREQQMEYRERLGAHIKPDWSLAEYHQHVADALLASPALARVIQEAKAEAWDEGSVVGYAYFDMTFKYTKRENPYRDRTEEPT